MYFTENHWQKMLSETFNIKYVHYEKWDEKAHHMLQGHLKRQIDIKAN